MRIACTSAPPIPLDRGEIDVELPVMEGARVTPVVESRVMATVAVSVASLTGAEGAGNSFWEAMITIAARARAMRRRFSMNGVGITAQDRSRRCKKAGIWQADEW
jgi:hypothetical protein